jgi:hypothetical protein
VVFGKKRGRSLFLFEWFWGLFSRVHFDEYLIFKMRPHPLFFFLGDFVPG